MSTSFISFQGAIDASLIILYSDVVNSSRFTQLKGGGIELYDSSDTLILTIYDSGEEFRYDPWSTLNFGASRGPFDNPISPSDLLLGKNLSKAKFFFTQGGGSHTINKVEVTENRGDGTWPSGDQNMTLSSGKYSTALIDLTEVITILDISVNFKFGVGEF